MHLDDLFGNGKTKTRAALSLCIRAVHLMELFEDAGLVLFGNARASICHADGKVAVCGLGAHSYLSGVGEFDGVADKVEQNLGEALLVSDSNG